MNKSRLNHTNHKPSIESKKLLSHKNKRELPYRQHFPSHPVEQKLNFEIDENLQGSTGLLRESNLRHMRKRSGNRNVH